ncbi:TRAP transporter small permease [Ectopseudomonas toyotomiensis]|uniref:TRAP transporter small permease protein n=1 Tax=Ectopseudomonas toyotomiensis TaxID=554344 RepID=A0ABD7DTX5_9GAMM|nr:TRAP transporter small permease [Pseudomonas toyotomiensis]QSL91829.1 TRAP transporter small permease [Pseudomonas toyotomiensis]
MMAVQTSSYDSLQSGALAQMVRWVDNAIVALSVVAVITALVAMFVSLMAEVVVRYLTNQGMGWPTEMPNILFPWLVMGGIVLAAQRGQHIAVTAIQGWIGRGGNRVLLIGHQALISATFFYLAWVGLDVIEITGGEIYPVTGISAKWAYLAMIAGFVGLAFTALTTLVHLLYAGDPLAVRAHQIEDDV